MLSFKEHTFQISKQETSLTAYLLDTLYLTVNLWLLMKITIRIDGNASNPSTWAAHANGSLRLRLSLSA